MTEGKRVERESLKVRGKREDTRREKGDVKSFEKSKRVEMES